MECKKCLIKDKIDGVSINRDRLCNLCTGEKKFGVLADPEIEARYNSKQELYTEFLKLIKSTRGTAVSGAIS